MQLVFYIWLFTFMLLIGLPSAVCFTIYIVFNIIGVIDNMKNKKEKK